MKVLVTTGSKYGSTREVGRAIADELIALGFEVDFQDACDVLGVHFYDAIVVGSAVYGGLWRRDAAELIRDHVIDLHEREVYMFSVGMEPIVRPGQPLDEAEALARDVAARQHVRFPGCLQWDRLNVGEKAIIRALNPPKGDFRDFEEIRDWAQRVGAELRTVAAV
ncbi:MULTISPECIES: flavodoxin domain-containing protein [Demequina]|uniref:Flavodoxin domain-containing protein n=1 Tax=Demequina muriae TaxID=3051664 RepID=A0ABT8GLB4_9MICO|nr:MULTISPECIES: flavodoxin domain-containing protein [Demequina]MDN4481726.1 flavodoxin domain-containing protein [Demequina sp. EGI L300058]